MRSSKLGLGALLIGMSTLVSGTGRQGAGSPLPLVVRATSLQAGGSLKVTVANEGDKAIRAWSLKVVYVLPDGRRGTSSARLDLIRAASARQAGIDLPVSVSDGIAPGGTYAHRVGMPAHSAVVAIESECVVFEDGAGAGSSECVGSLLKHREELANVASRWLGVLQRALDRPDDATAVRSLREAVRAQGVPESGAITGDDADFGRTLVRLAASGEQDVRGFRRDAQRWLAYWTDLHREALRHAR